MTLLQTDCNKANGWQYAAERMTFNPAGIYAYNSLEWVAAMLGISWTE